MTAFLAEAAALVARKPGELFELTQALLSDAPAAHGQPLGGPGSVAADEPASGSDVGSGPGFSLLAVAALRQALRVAGSGKMAADARAGIAAYVAGAPSLEEAMGFFSVCLMPFANWHYCRHTTLRALTTAELVPVTSKLLFEMPELTGCMLCAPTPRSGE